MLQVRLDVLQTVAKDYSIGSELMRQVTAAAPHGIMLL